MAKGNGLKVIVSMIGLDGHTTGGEVVCRDGRRRSGREEPAEVAGFSAAMGRL